MKIFENPRVSAAIILLFIGGLVLIAAMAGMKAKVEAAMANESLWQPYINTTMIIDSIEENLTYPANLNKTDSFKYP